MAGRREYKQKLLPNKQKKIDIFGREHSIAGVPIVVVAVPRIDVPVLGVRVPVHVHDVRSLSYSRSSIPPPLDYSRGCILLGT